VSTFLDIEMYLKKKSSFCVAAAEELSCVAKKQRNKTGLTDIMVNTLCYKPEGHGLETGWG
jgi:hypothetical protein